MDTASFVLMGSSIMPKKTKFGGRHVILISAQSVSYYLMIDSKADILRAKSTKTASDSSRAINLGKPPIPNNKSLLGKAPSGSTN